MLIENAKSECLIRNFVKIKIEKARINGLPPYLKGLLRPSTAYAAHHSGGTPGCGTEAYANRLSIMEGDTRSREHTEAWDLIPVLVHLF